MNLKTDISKFGVNQIISYVRKDPQNNLIKVIDFAKKVSPKAFQNQIAGVEKILANPQDVHHKWIVELLETINPEVFDTLVVNFFLEASLLGDPLRKKAREKYQCNIPWTILLDFTTACNLHCEGCWAAEYGHQLNLSFEEIDDIIEQGKEFGTHFYIFTGGEPMVRKDDVFKICEKHDDCAFLMFTNGTLIDESVIEELKRLKNLVPAISIEGSEETTDQRRGKGTYQKVIRAMDLLKENHLPFGMSCCYTSFNYEAITSDEFIDEMIEKGVLFGWFFHYMPVGGSASPELLLTPEQRKHVYYNIRRQRENKPIFLMDFQNDAEFVGGCIAGGREYMHINANGDVEPCVFIHYSDSNIREKSLLESFQSPLFMEYYEGQPFNENMLRPCPMLENPELLRKIVKASNAKSTDILQKEDVEQLCAKCDRYAELWQPVSEELWAART